MSGIALGLTARIDAIAGMLCRPSGPDVAGAISALSSLCAAVQRREHYRRPLIARTDEEARRLRAEATFAALDLDLGAPASGARWEARRVAARARAGRRSVRRRIEAARSSRRTR